MEPELGKWKGEMERKGDGEKMTELETGNRRRELEKGERERERKGEGETLTE
jgi:hypothetical protein